jgi:small subunit ribosomal protein S1
MSPAGNSRHFEIEVSQADKDLFSALLDGKYDYSFKRGDVLSGRVMSFDAQVASVDVGAKTNAVLPVKELNDQSTAFSDELVLDETYEFYILKEEDAEGRLTLSLRRVAVAHTWKNLQAAMEAEELIECQVSAVVKGGLLVDVKGLRGFVPSSHLRNRNNLEEMIGQTLPLKILAVDPLKNNIILSHRRVMNEQAQEQRKDLFAKLEVGSVKEGQVVRITEFGAFIDLGGIDGLLPLSQMSWRWVEHPSDVLAIGDNVKAEVIGVDVERQRVSLSVKALLKDPWVEVAETFQQGSQVEGKITRIKQFGAFVARL